MIPVELENARLKLTLTIPTDAPISVANEMLLFATDTTNNDLLKHLKKQHIC